MRYLCQLDFETREFRAFEWESMCADKTFGGEKNGTRLVSFMLGGVGKWGQTIAWVDRHVVCVFWRLRLDRLVHLVESRLRVLQ